MTLFEEYHSIMEAVQNDPDVREKMRQRMADISALFGPARLGSINGRLAMQVKRHDRGHLVELRDGSAWRIWPGDIPKTLQWLSTTEIDLADIDDKICSHSLIDRSNGSRVRVISVSEQWPTAAVRRCLRHG